MIIFVQLFWKCVDYMKNAKRKRSSSGTFFEILGISGDIWHFCQKWQYFRFFSLLLQKASTPSIFVLGQSFKDHCKAKCIGERSSTRFFQFRSCFHWERVWMKKIEGRVFWFFSIFTTFLWLAHTFIKLIFKKLESNISF